MSPEADTSFERRQFDREREAQQWQSQQYRQAEQAIELIVQTFRPTLQLQASALRACADGLQALAQNLEMIERNIQREQTTRQRTVAYTSVPVRLNVGRIRARECALFPCHIVDILH
jgi:hypothetical protein